MDTVASEIGFRLEHFQIGYAKPQCQDTCATTSPFWLAEFFVTLRPQGLNYSLSREPNRPHSIVP